MDFNRKVLDMKHVIFTFAMLFTLVVFYTTGALVAGGQPALERIILDLHR